MEYTDLVEAFNAYCTEKKITPPRETYIDLRSLWTTYYDQRENNAVSKMCQEFIESSSSETVVAQRKLLSTAFCEIIGGLWRVGEDHPMRQPPNPVVPGLEVEEIMAVARHMVKTDLSTDEFLLISMLLSGLKWNEVVGIEWSNIVMNENSDTTFALGDRELPLSFRVDKRDFYYVLNLAKTRSAGRVFSQGSGALRNAFNLAVEKAQKGWVTPSVLRNRWMMDEISSGNSNKETSRRAGLKIEYYRRVHHAMLDKYREESGLS